MSNASLYWKLLSAHGVSLERLGLRDVALCRADARAAIEILRSSSMPVLGGDVYCACGGDIEPAYANWHSDRVHGESIEDYVNRTCDETSAYILGYPERAEVTPLFVLVVSEGERLAEDTADTE